jgi:DNA-binding NarL/FixJ family response regulator
LIAVPFQGRNFPYFQDFLLNTSRVLVAEDNDALRARLVRILDREFRVVGAVANGDELVASVLSMAPDAVVSELFTSQLDGISAHIVLRELNNQTPFVFVSDWHSVHTYLERLPAAYVHRFDIPLCLNPAVRAAVAGEPYLSTQYSKHNRREPS